MQLQASGNPANPGVQGGAAIGGNLNFGSVPSSTTDYAGAYQNALGLNQSNYANILAGYQQTAGQQQTAQQAIEGGYGNLYGAVQNTIQGIGASQSQAIADTYAQQSGNSAQDMINRGLGNTTVQQSVQRGNLLDEQKAQTGLANQMAQLQAGYQSNLGQAGLNYANQANMQNTALSGQQLNWMNSVNSPYPNAQAYGNLALQQGYAQQAKLLAGQAPRGGGYAGGVSINDPGFGNPNLKGFDPNAGGGGVVQGPSAPASVPSPQPQGQQYGGVAQTSPDTSPTPGQAIAGGVEGAAGGTANAGVSPGGSPGGTAYWSRANSDQERAQHGGGIMIQMGAIDLSPSRKNKKRKGLSRKGRALP
jgi:hypothetical protein